MIAVRCDLVRACLLLVALAIVACSPGASRHRGRIVVALTIDWEGAEMSAEGLDTFEDLRKALGPVPFTHFVCPAYITKPKPDPQVLGTLAEEIKAGDELAVHLHAWRSLALAAGIEPKLSPSLFTGTDQVLELDDGDAGFDTDLDAYTVPELRALLRTSRALLERTHLRVSTSFRAGGYLGTPKLLLALADENYAVDSSAVDSRQLKVPHAEALPARLAQIWPHVDAQSQPSPISGPGKLLELPIAAVADYVATPDIIKLFEAAHARLAADPTKDVFVVLAMHLETGPDFANRIGDAMAAVRGRKDIAGELLYVTVEQAAELARF